MIHLARENGILNEAYARPMLISRRDHVLAFERGGLVFVFNFDPQRTLYDWVIPVSAGCDHELVLSTDDPAFGGFGNIVNGRCSACVPGYNSPAIRLNLPPRTAVVLKACVQ